MITTTTTHNFTTNTEHLPLYYTLAVTHRPGTFTITPPPPARVLPEELEGNPERIAHYLLAHHINTITAAEPEALSYTTRITINVPSFTGEGPLEVTATTTRPVDFPQANHDTDREMELWANVNLDPGQPS